MIAIFSEADCSLAADWNTYVAARAALGTSQYAAIRRLRCRVREGVVEIFGRVPSFYLKQVAQAAVLGLEGANVRNLVEVSGS